MATKKQKTPIECKVVNTNNLEFRQFPSIGKTICTLKSDTGAFNELAEKLVNDSNDSLIFLWGKRTYMKPYYSAVSKVNSKDGDSYDEREGQVISKEKAVDKFQHDMANKLLHLYGEINKILAAVIHYMDKHHIDYSKAPTYKTVLNTKYRDAYPTYYCQFSDMEVDK